VVDPEDLLFVEDPVHRVVQGLGAGQVRAERFLHDYARPVHQVRLAQCLDHVLGRLGWNAEVVQPADLAADRCFGLGHPGGEAVRPGRLGHEAQPLLEPRPLQERDLAGCVLVTRLTRQVAELLVGELAPGDADHAVFGEHARLRQVQETR
jgi:hypothetical protein